MISIFTMIISPNFNEVLSCFLIDTGGQALTQSPASKDSSVCCPAARHGAKLLLAAWVRALGGLEFPFAIEISKYFK